MQRFGDEAEVLLKIDDIAITLTVDVRMGFKRKNLLRDHPYMTSPQRGRVVGGPQEGDKR